MTTLTTAPFDTERAEAFGGHVLGMINDAFLVVGLSVGHQTGLFDTMASHEPATSAELAVAAELNERYVREWLGAMTVGRIVDYDPATDLYALPAEHAASLTRAAGPGNLAGMSQFLGLLAPVEPEIVECFRSGGGLGYDRYPRFAELMREDSANVFDAALVETVVPIVPGLHEQLRAGVQLADIGCGAGHAINLLARAYPASTFTGIDLSEEALTIARAEAAEWGLTNAHFVIRDAANLGFQREFDAVTAFDAIHDQARPRDVLAGIRRALKPGGLFLMADIAASSNLEDNLENPLAPFGYTVSYLHCMSVSLAEGGEGLGTMWGEQKAQELLNEAGFASVTTSHVEGDILNTYYVARP